MQIVVQQLSAKESMRAMNNVTMNKKKCNEKESMAIDNNLKQQLFTADKFSINYFTVIIIHVACIVI